MDKKLNPLDWEIDLLWDTVSDIIRKLNPLTWRLELVYSANSYIQKINPFIWDFDIIWGTGASYITKTLTWNWYINLTNAVANHLMELKAYGWIEQNWTPTPTIPVDIVCNNWTIKYSQNELNPAEIEIWYYRVQATGVLTESPYNFVTGYMPVKPNQSYVFFGRRKDDNRLSSYNRIHWFDADKEFISTNTYTKDTIGTGIAPANAYFAQCSCNESWATSRETTQEIVDGYDRVFEMATEEVPYIPYVEWWIYVDWTTETIEITGKNLNGGGELDNKGYTSTGSTSTSTTFCGTLWKIKVKEGEKYTLSYGNFPDGISGVFVNTWKTDGTWNLRQAISISDSYTYTIPSGIGEVNFTLYKTGGIAIASNSWLQVEKGETATEYEPYYSGGTATAETLLKIWDYADEQEILSWNIIRKVGYKIFDWTESFTASTAYGKACLVQSAAGNWGAIKYNVLCTHFKGLPQTSWNQPDYTCFFNASGHFYFRLEDNTVATFKQWLADQYAAWTPVIVFFALSTETTETVAWQTLHIQNWNNTVKITQASIDDLPLEVHYDATE